MDDVVGLRLDDVGWMMSLFQGPTLACQAGINRKLFYEKRDSVQKPEPD